MCLRGLRSAFQGVTSEVCPCRVAGRHGRQKTIDGETNIAFLIDKDHKLLRIKLHLITEVDRDLIKYWKLKMICTLYKFDQIISKTDKS